MDKKIKRIDARRIDLTGKTFGDLKVIKLSNKRGTGNTLLWECECSCGNTTYVQGYSLIHDHYKSCGCKHAEKRDKGLEKHIEKDAKDGTRISALKAKKSSRNTSGHKGVSWEKRSGKWHAYIGIKGKNKHLGYFDDLEDAVKARKEAEEKYHKPYIKKLEEKENEND